jgi:hypothetical protein
MCGEGHSHGLSHSLHFLPAGLTRIPLLLLQVIAGEPLKTMSPGCFQPDIAVSSQTTQAPSLKETTSARCVPVLARSASSLGHGQNSFSQQAV